MKITVIGEVNHGKTSLIEKILFKKLLKARAELKDLRTRDLQVEDFIIEDKTHYILDCPGHSSYLNNSILPIPYSDLIIIVFSAVQGSLPEKIISLLEYCKYHKCKILLVISKVDLCSREIFIKRVSKILSLLEIAGIKDYEYCIFSTEEPLLRTALLNKIKEIDTKIERSNKNNNLLVLRSFNTNIPGKPISQYESGILGCISKEGLEEGSFYLNEKDETTAIEIISIKDPSKDNRGYITCMTNLSGCYCSFNRLKGAIISKEPLERNVEVILTIDKFIGVNPKIKLKECYLVVGFSSYLVSLVHLTKNKYHVTLPILSELTFLILTKNEKIWNLVAFGRINKK